MRHLAELATLALPVAIGVTLAGCGPKYSADTEPAAPHLTAPPRQLDVPATRASSIAGDVDVDVAEMLVFRSEAPGAYLHVWISASDDNRVLEAFSFPLARPDPEWEGRLPVGSIHQSRVNGNGVYVSASSHKVGTARVKIDYFDGPSNVDEALDVEFARGDGHKDVAPGLRVHWGVRRER